MKINDFVLSVSRVLEKIMKKVIIIGIITLIIGTLVFSATKFYNKEIDLNRIIGTSDMKKIKDLKGNPLLLFVNAWSVGMVLDRNEGLILSEFGRD